MKKIHQMLTQLSKIDKQLNNLYKRNRIVNHQIQIVQQKRMALVKKIEAEQFVENNKPFAS